MSKFYDFCAAKYPSPEDTLAAFFPEMVDAAASVGGLLADMPILDGRAHYLPNMAGRSDKTEYYRASVEQDKDGTIWPAITFGTFKGGDRTEYFKPRDLAWQQFEASRGAAVVNDSARQNYRAAAAAAVAVAEASAAEQDRERTEGHQAAAAAAVTAWEAAKPCEAHPYLERKGVSAYGLRVASAQMRAKLWRNDQAKWQTAVAVAAGDLLVPMVDAAGNLVNLQRIDAKGEKLFLTGGRKKGMFYRIEGTAPAWLAEGYATGATVHEATSAAVIVAFDAGNLQHVAAALEGDTLHAVAADNDAKGAGSKAAAATGLPFHMPPTVGDDWNDHAARYGLDAVTALLVQAAAPVVVPTVPAAILSDADKAIAELNEKHALTLIGGQVMVLHETLGEREGKELLFQTTAAFKTWYLPRTVPVEGKDRQGNPVIKHAQIADLWLKSSKRRQYEGVTFAPAGNAPVTYYNLWRGFAYEPLDCGMFAAGMKCRRLLSHMKYTLCNGDRKHFRHLLAWAADMVQQPDRKKGVALVLRGAKGTGKSTFAEALTALLGRHAMKVTHMRHLTGNFNRHLADKLLVVAEESFWAGDKSDEGALKDMITSDRMTIEAKGVDAIEMPSLCRVMMITNNEWAVPASNDERRYFVLDVSDKRRQAVEYFSTIHAQLDGNGNEGLRALLTVLKAFDLKPVNLRIAPETQALRTQRAFSLEPHDQFVFDALSEHCLIGQDWEHSVTVGKDEAYDAYIEASRKRGKLHLLSKEQFAKKFIRATGAKAARLRDGLARRHVYQVPAWDEAVNQFQKACGVDVARQVNDENEPL